MKKLLVGLMLLTSLPSFAKTEIVCQSSYYSKYKNKINERIQELEDRGVFVEITLLSTSSAGAGTKSTKYFREKECVVIKY